MLVTTPYGFGKEMVVGYLSVKTDCSALGPWDALPHFCGVSLSSVDKGLFVCVVQLCSPDGGCTLRSCFDSHVTKPLKAKPGAVSDLPQ